MAPHASAISNEDVSNMLGDAGEGNFIENPDSPDLEWVRNNPNGAFAYFFVNPHPCLAFDELMKL